MTASLVGAKKILIVDDSVTVLALIARVLEKVGCNVTKALSGGEAIEMLENGFLPDCIILDRQMPEMSGDFVLIQIKNNKKTSAIPIMILTSDNNPSDVSTCMELGANDYMTKPFEEDDLLARLGKIMT